MWVNLSCSLFHPPDVFMLFVDSFTLFIVHTVDSRRTSCRSKAKSSWNSAALCSSAEKQLLTHIYTDIRGLKKGAEKRKWCHFLLEDPGVCSPFNHLAGVLALAQNQEPDSPIRRPAGRLSSHRLRLPAAYKLTGPGDPKHSSSTELTSPTPHTNTLQWRRRMESESDSVPEEIMQLSEPGLSPPTPLPPFHYCYGDSPCICNFKGGWNCCWHPDRLTVISTISVGSLLLQIWVVLMLDKSYHLQFTLYQLWCLT